MSQPLQRLCEHMSCRSAAQPASSHAMRFAGNITLFCLSSRCGHVEPTTGAALSMKGRGLA